LTVLPPDLEVLPSSTARCGPIRIFEGGSFILGIPFVPQPVWISSICCYILLYVLSCRNALHPPHLPSFFPSSPPLSCLILLLTSLFPRSPHLPSHDSCSQSECIKESLWWEIKRCEQGGLTSTPSSKKYSGLMVLSDAKASKSSMSAIQDRHSKRLPRSFQRGGGTDTWVRRDTFWVPDSAMQRYGHDPPQMREHVADGPNGVTTGMTSRRADLLQGDQEETLCRGWMEWCDKKFTSCLDLTSSFRFATSSQTSLSYRISINQRTLYCIPFKLVRFEGKQNVYYDVSF